jgi:TPR repeat protein
MTKAVEWYREAALQGESNAQYNLGCCYNEGNGVQRDELKAAQCFYKAARQGDKDAKDALRRLLDHDDIDE